MAVEVLDRDSGLAMRLDDQGLFCREPLELELGQAELPQEDWSLLLPGGFGLDQCWHSEDGTKTIWSALDGEERVRCSACVRACVLE
jgi:hypothetical protein